MTWRARRSQPGWVHQGSVCAAQSCPALPPVSAGASRRSASRAAVGGRTTQRASAAEHSDHVAVASLQQLDIVMRPNLSPTLSNIAAAGEGVTPGSDAEPLDASASCHPVQSLVRNSVGDRARLQALVFRRQARKPRGQWTASGFIPLVERTWLTMRLAARGPALRTHSWHYNHDAPLPRLLVSRISISANTPQHRLRRSIAEKSRPQLQPQFVGISHFVRRRVY